MCDSPYIIKNPSFDSDGKFRHRLSCLHDTRSPYIPVPCGRCQACLRMAQQYLIQRFHEHFKGRWAVFCTATYSTPALRYIHSVGVDGKEYDTAYCDVDDFRLMVKRIRKDKLVSRPFTYWCTTEYGGQFHRPHFHYFIFFERYDTDTELDGYSLAEEWNSAFVKEWRRNIAVNASGKRNTRAPRWLPLSKFIRRTRTRRGTYDVHLVTSSGYGSDDMDDPIFYASKYCLKFDKWARRKLQAFHESMKYEDYKDARRKFRPRFLLSRGFGISKDTETFVKDCIKWSISNMHYPCYLNADGKSFPLCLYYKKKYLNLHDRLDFVRRHPEDYYHEPDGDLYDLIPLSRLPDNSHDSSVMLKDKQRNALKFEKICSHLRQLHNLMLFDYDS